MTYDNRLREEFFTVVDTACFDDEDNFLGHQPRACGEHRTAGPHRAYCYDCHEWCYPTDGCFRCRHVDG